MSGRDYLRHTGAFQPLILTSALPFCALSACNYNVVQTPRPLHTIHIKSDLVNGVFANAVCPSLPVTVVMLMGNDIAGGKVTPKLEVFVKPIFPDLPETVISDLSLYPSYVLNCAQSKKMYGYYGWLHSYRR